MKDLITRGTRYRTDKTGDFITAGKCESVQDIYGFIDFLMPWLCSKYVLCRKIFIFIA